MLLFALLLTFGGPSSATGANSSAGKNRKVSASSGMGQFLKKWMDAAHAEISKSILNTARRFDSFFGDERIHEEQQSSQIKVTTTVELNEKGQTDFSFPLSTNLALPRLEHKVHLFVDSLLKEGQTADIPVEDKTKGTNVKLGLRYFLLQKVREWVSLDSGVRLSGANLALSSLEPFASLRIRGTTDFEPWALRLTQFGNWFKEDGFSASTRADLERYFGRRTFFRVTGYAQWLEYEPGVQWIQSLFLRRQFSDKRALGVELSVAGQTSAPAAVAEYTANLTYRRRLYKDWVFGAVEPGLRFLRADNFALAPVIIVKLEIQFGRSSE